MREALPTGVKLLHLQAWQHRLQGDVEALRRVQRQLRVRQAKAADRDWILVSAEPSAPAPAPPPPPQAKSLGLSWCI